MEVAALILAFATLLTAVTLAWIPSPQGDNEQLDWHRRLLASAGLDSEDTI